MFRVCAKEDVVTYKLKRRLSLLVLVVMLPVWIVVATTVMGQFDRPHILVELGVYLALGIAWALPFKRVFQGVGKPDPDAPREDG
ncbi:MAG: DUF2842 domain-containing protein [Pseudomonadota bacterium]